MLGCLLFLLPIAVCFIFSCLTREVIEMSQEGIFVLKGQYSFSESYVEYLLYYICGSLKDI